jgi:hypothetical protein
LSIDNVESSWTEVTAKSMVSPLAALAIAARSEPAPLSAPLVTVIVLIARFRQTAAGREHIHAFRATRSPHDGNVKSAGSTDRMALLAFKKQSIDIIVA